MKENIHSDKKQVELEKCVVCGKETKIPKDRHIYERRYYVEGCGQLCELCYHDIYKNFKN